MSVNRINNVIAHRGPRFRAQKCSYIEYTGAAMTTARADLKMLWQARLNVQRQARLPDRHRRNHGAVGHAATVARTAAPIADAKRLRDWEQVGDKSGSVRRGRRETQMKGGKRSWTEGMGKAKAGLADIGGKSEIRADLSADERRETQMKGGKRRWTEGMGKAKAGLADIGGKSEIRADLSADERRETQMKDGSKRGERCKRACLERRKACGTWLWGRDESCRAARTSLAGVRQCQRSSAPGARS
jgi:hypothetical protein